MPYQSRDLRRAIEQGSYETVQAILSERDENGRPKIDINTEGYQGSSTLIVALTSKEPSPRIINALLDVIDINGEYVLDLAGPGLGGNPILLFALGPGPLGENLSVENREQLLRQMLARLQPEKIAEIDAQLGVNVILSRVLMLNNPNLLREFLSLKLPGGQLVFDPNPGTLGEYSLLDVAYSIGYSDHDEMVKVLKEYDSESYYEPNPQIKVHLTSIMFLLSVRASELQVRQFGEDWIAPTLNPYDSFDPHRVTSVNGQSIENVDNRVVRGFLGDKQSTHKVTQSANQSIRGLQQHYPDVAVDAEIDKVIRFFEEIRVEEFYNSSYLASTNPDAESNRQKFEAIKEDANACLQHMLRQDGGRAMTKTLGPNPNSESDEDELVSIREVLALVSAALHDKTAVNDLAKEVGVTQYDDADVAFRMLTLFKVIASKNRVNNGYPACTTGLFNAVLIAADRISPYVKLEHVSLAYANIRVLEIRDQLFKSKSTKEQDRILDDLRVSVESGALTAFRDDVRRAFLSDEVVGVLNDQDIADITSTIMNDLPVSRAMYSPLPSPHKSPSTSLRATPDNSQVASETPSAEPSPRALEDVSLSSDSAFEESFDCLTPPSSPELSPRSSGRSSPVSSLSWLSSEESPRDLVETPRAPSPTPRSVEVEALINDQTLSDETLLPQEQPQTEHLVEEPLSTKDPQAHVELQPPVSVPRIYQETDEDHKHYRQLIIKTRKEFLQRQFHAVLAPALTAFSQKVDSVLRRPNVDDDTLREVEQVRDILLAALPRFQGVLSSIDEMEQFAQQVNNKGEPHYAPGTKARQTVDNCVLRMRHEYRTFVRRLDFSPNRLSTLARNCQKHARDAQPELYKHRGGKKVLDGVLVGLTMLSGIGAIVLAIRAGVMYKKTGYARLGFLDTNGVKKLHEVEQKTGDIKDVDVSLFTQPFGMS